MSEHFDAVIIGSGFGGSVMSYRLAQEGLNVCLLERGKAYPPGSFPRSPLRLKENFWDPGSGLYGMYNVWSFDRLAALISSGLGGGSLIYANVLIRKDERWFVKEDPSGRSTPGWEYWPVNRADLDPHYDVVEKMLNAQPYPIEHEPFDRTVKTHAMQQAYQALNQNPRYRGEVSFGLPPLAVSFRQQPFSGTSADSPPVIGEPIAEPNGPNLHGKTRYTCRLCGECDVGCNYGSKNTLDFNYLTEARRLGAEIRTLAEVKELAPRAGGGYRVRYQQHQPGLDPDAPRVMHELSCQCLVLSAGAIGSPFLLLKNRSSFAGFSERLGTRFCGNGDLLSFALRAGTKSSPMLLEGSLGPVITSFIRMRDELDGGRGRGFYVEDAGYPDFANWMMQMSDVPGRVKALHIFAKRWLRRRFGWGADPDMGREISELFGSTRLSSSTLPLLGMGRDTPDGTMRLGPEGRYLTVDWKKEGSAEMFENLKNTMKDIAGAWNAEFQVNPTYRLGRLITVHPLGGCPMGETREEGFVSPWGEVFGYPGFYVADGSVMPGPVGPNPSLTIAAMANRSADHIIDNWKSA